VSIHSETVVMLLAGGRGQRLDPLTRDRAKPAVPFGGIYRIIDFSLSNAINSGLRRVFVLTQYKSISLSRHLRQGWGFLSYPLGEFIENVPAQQRLGEDWYRGTADAIWQNVYLLEQQRPRCVLILSGDHVYTMDYTGMVAYHHAAGAAATLCVQERPIEEGASLGVLQVDHEWRVIGFEEKPSKPKPIPGKPDRVLAGRRDDRRVLVGQHGPRVRDPRDQPLWTGLATEHLPGALPTGQVPLCRAQRGR